MKFNHLKAFVLLTENHLNISRTALKMNTVQSAVSRAIQQLEADLDYPLFEREAKRLIRLTPFGKTVLDKAQRMLTLNREIQQFAEHSKASDEGQLRIATTHTQAKYLLPLAIPLFKKKFPKIELNIHQGSPDLMVSMVERRQADLAICTENIHQSQGLDFKICYEWQHVVVVPKNHALAEHKQLSIQQLTREPLITYVFGFTGRSALQQLFEEAQCKPNVVISASDTDIIKTYVRLGLGMGIIANIGYDIDLDSDLVCVPIKDAPVATTKAAWLKSDFQSPYMQTFVHLLTTIKNKAYSTY